MSKLREIEVDWDDVENDDDPPYVDKKGNKYNGDVVCDWKETPGDAIKGVNDALKEAGYDKEFVLLNEGSDTYVFSLQPRKMKKGKTKPVIANPKVHFNHRVAGGGVMSSISWTSPDFVKALYAMFGVRDGHEVITEISVTKNGIDAYFESSVRDMQQKAKR
jgi:hypothetical protein